MDAMSATEPNPGTDDARMLAALRYEPLTAQYLYRNLGVMAHSRAASLRKRGFDVRCTRIPGRKGAAGFLYTLGPASSGEDDCAATPLLTRESQSARRTTPVASPLSADQLTLEVSARGAYQ